MKTDRLPGLSARCWLGYKKSYQWLSGRPGQLPATVIVAGTQRSGTNMLMDILDRNLQTDVFHERDRRAYQRYVMRELPLILRLRDGTRAPFFVLKALCELHLFPGILDTLAPAKVVWLVRWYGDAVHSMTVSFSSFSKQIKKLAIDRNSLGWRGLGMSDQTHELLCYFAERCDNEATAAALQWYYRNVLFFERGLHVDSRARLLFYEALVTDPATEVASVCEFMALPSQPFMWSNVSRRSVRYRQVEDIHPEVRELCEGLWQRFGGILPPSQKTP